VFEKVSFHYQASFYLFINQQIFYNKNGMFKIRYVFFGLFFIFTGCSFVGNASEYHQTGIKGIVTNELKQPVSDAYVYLYRSLSSKLIGPSDFMEKTAENGTFFFDVPEGKYYVVARKRSHGGDAGPLKQGDRATIYPRNPVTVLPNRVSEIEITLPEKKAFYFKRVPFGNTPITVKVLTNTTKRLKLLIYHGESVKRAPDHVVELEENRATFSLLDDQKYIIVVREELREKVGEDELYIEYGPFIPSEIKGEILLELKK